MFGGCADVSLLSSITTWQLRRRRSFHEEEVTVQNGLVVVRDGDGRQTHGELSAQGWLTATISDHRAQVIECLHISGNKGRLLWQRHRSYFVLCWTTQSDARACMCGRVLVAAATRRCEDDDILVLRTSCQLRCRRSSGALGDRSKDQRSGHDERPGIHVRGSSGSGRV